MQFYKTTLWDERFNGQRDLSDTRIIYSFVASMSALRYGDAYNIDGFFDAEKMRDIEGDWIPIRGFSVTELSKTFNVSRQTVYNAKQHLMDVNLLEGDNLFIIPDLFSKGYFSLLPDTGLTGTDLIVYSYIVYRRDVAQMKFGELSMVDTFGYKIAQELNMSLSTVRKSMQRCARMGWIERKAICNNGKVRWYIKVTDDKLMAQ